MRKDLRQRFRKEVSALSGPLPPLKGNVVASAANSRSLKLVYFISLFLFRLINSSSIVVLTVIH